MQIIHRILKYHCYLLFFKTILLLREMHILYTFYFSYLRFKKVSHCPRQVFISFNCLRFEWDNIHKIINPVPGIQQELAIVTILFIKFWEWRTDVEGIMSSWCWWCFAHVSFWIMVFSVICSIVVILFLEFFKGISVLFSKWLYQFTFPSTMQGNSLPSTPSPAFIVCRFFDDGCSDQCRLLPYCSFDLPFSCMDVRVGL